LGEGNGVVILTGSKTALGRTTELVQEARPKLHIEAAVAKVVRMLFIIVGVLMGVVIVMMISRGAPLLEMIPLMLILLTSAVPLSLPVMFTVSMAVGAKERHIFDGMPAVTPVSFAPFDATNRRTEAVVEQNGQRLHVMKGAVRTVAEACGLQAPAIETLESHANESALKGYRTLAVARGPENGALTLVGLVTLYDPPRPDAKQIIAALYDLGVPVKMLTGDALAVASEIARGVGLLNMRRMADLKAVSAQAGSESIDLLAGTDGFAEVYPKDKYIVVQHLQAAGHVTGMTSDGVNDAPALRQAEVGIAVSSATDVAKGAATSS